MMSTVNLRSDYLTKITTIVATLPMAQAIEVLDFAQFIKARLERESQERWDDAFANTPDSVLDMFIAEAAQAEKEGSTQPIFDEHGKLILN